MKGIIGRKIFVFALIFVLLAVVIPINVKPINNYSTGTNDEIIIIVDDEEGSEGENNPPENFTKIQDAINEAINHNVSIKIVVKNGTYKENIVINWRSYNESKLRIIGESKKSTIIEGLSSITNIEVSNDVDNIMIKNFTIQKNAQNGIIIKNGAVNTENNQYIIIENCIIQNYSECGIKIERDEVKIINCSIKNNYNGYGANKKGNGIYLTNTEQPKSLSHINIIDSIIEDNGDTGIEYGNGNNNYSADFLIDNCSINNHSKYAMLIKYAENIKISNCTITNNSENVGLKNSNACIFDNCIIIEGITGIVLEDSSTGNIIQESDFIQLDTAIKIRKQSNNNIITNCNIINSNNRSIEIKASVISSPTNNRIYYNNFINNTKLTKNESHAYDDGRGNEWDDGNGTGNYWSDYDEESEGAYDNDSNGIFDDPYIISGKLISNYDEFPINLNTSDNKKPIVKIKFPLENIYLQGEINIRWNATDDEDDDVDSCPSKNLTINITLISYNETEDIIAFEINNSGNYIWNTLDVSYGYYKINISANDGNKIGYAESNDYFIIFNDDRPFLSNFNIKNENYEFKDYVKNEDSVIISVDVIGVGITNENIKGNFSNLGKKVEILPDIYTGITAIWFLTNVNCSEENGVINISVSVTDRNEKSSHIIGCITSDNLKPNITIKKSNPGLYILNRKIISFYPLKFNIFNFSLFFGATNLLCEANDESGIYSIEWNVNNIIKNNVENYMLKRTKLNNLTPYNLGRKKIEISVTDNAGNKNTTSFNYIII